METYTKSNNNIFLREGSLIIKALKDSKTGEITSGGIKTAGKFSMKYGRVDVKAKLPVGTGLWPAVWMMPEKDTYGGWAASGEIDIMENKGRLPGEVYGTLHYGGSWPNNKYAGATYVFPKGQSAADFHIYSLEWEPGEMRWYVDGKLYQKQNNWYTKDGNGEKYSYPAPFDQKFYLILNLAFGGNFDEGKYNTSVLPVEMAVDYVRAYKLTGRPYKTPVDPNNISMRKTIGSSNLILNGSFDNGTVNWVHWKADWENAASSISITDGMASVHIDYEGQEYWATQLAQDKFNVESGKTYVLSFDARFSIGRNIQVIVEHNIEPNTKYLWNTVLLTTDLQHFTYEFKMSTADYSTHHVFALGRIDGNTVSLGSHDVYIDNVKLAEKTS